jgi:septal ring factor EnvC (AmiA/AmiB activator)
MSSKQVRQLEDRLAQVEDRVRSQGERLRNQRDRLDRQRELLAEVTGAARRAPELFEILARQVAAMEERLQDLVDRVELATYDATDAEQAEARSLVEDIREEHRRARVKLGVVVSYEERLRRVEAALTEEMAAAAELAHEAALHGVVANAPTAGLVDLPEDPPVGATSGP